MRTVALSAGHALNVRGASSDICDEVDEARRVCTQLAADLERYGAKCYGPFFDNSSDTQSENLSAIVNWHNAQGDHDLDVSVHFNAAGYDPPTEDPIGTEVLYVTQERLAEELAAAIAAAGALKNRGGKYRSDLKFLNQTQAPAVLLEIAFVCSQADVTAYEEHFRAICS